MDLVLRMLGCKLLMTCLTVIIALPSSIMAAAGVEVNISSIKGLNNVTFEPPPRKDAPRTGTAGGGSRTDLLACASSRTRTLTALSPGKHIGLSNDGRPVLFVYLPKTNAQVAELSIFDAKMNGVYQTNISVANSKGLIAIKLPEAPALVKNQPYYWSFALACNPQDRTEDWVVGGWIEYRQLSQNLQNQLKGATSIERISLYARNGYWYDAVATMIELQQKEPQNEVIARAWTELLTSVGLNLNIVATAN